MDLWSYEPGDLKDSAPQRLKNPWEIMGMIWLTQPGYDPQFAIEDLAEHDSWFTELKDGDFPYVGFPEGSIKH